MNYDNEIRSENNVFYGKVLGFDENRDILIQNHGKRGKSDIMRLSEINNQAYEIAMKIKWGTNCRHHYL